MKFCLRGLVAVALLLISALAYGQGAYVCGITNAPSAETCGSSGSTCSGTVYIQNMLPGVGWCIETIKVACCTQLLDNYQVHLPNKACQRFADCQGIALLERFTIAPQGTKFPKALASSLTIVTQKNPPIFVTEQKDFIVDRLGGF
ncbi:MAG: hypothetical protein JST79_18780 [Acidobacteria bacterium]|nr:hypothetical protein [Acidobacteriota bacterium]